MGLTSNAIVDGQPVPAANAFCQPDPEAHVRLAPNRNPVDLPRSDCYQWVLEPEVVAALHGHFLDQASLTGTHTLSPQV
ncbi:hypothetical protein BH18ACT5_BH18ACT5_12600 [soil metagenome]